MSHFHRQFRGRARGPRIRGGERAFIARADEHTFHGTGKINSYEQRGQRENHLRRLPSASPPRMQPSQRAHHYSLQQRNQSRSDALTVQRRHNDSSFEEPSFTTARHHVP